MQEPAKNIQQAVPFFVVIDMEASIRFYVEGLGFEIIAKWEPHEKIEWCCVQREGAALMLQEYHTEGPDAWTPEGKVGVGVSICFICEDALALYHEFIANGISTTEPFVGNNMWVINLYDPDGYALNFESSTDVPEETRYSEWEQA
jgi:catechol 2,3-dioxygenase-like lactoylglutathione lyase family enzyme